MSGQSRSVVWIELIQDQIDYLGWSIRLSLLIYSTVQLICQWLQFQLEGLIG